MLVAFREEIIVPDYGPHIFLSILAVPDTMRSGSQRRVFQLACRVVARLPIEIPVTVVVPVPPTVF